MSCTWLTMQEAANYIKVHYTTIQKYVGTEEKPGKLKSSRAMGVIRICLEDLRDFMEGKSG